MRVIVRTLWIFSLGLIISGCSHKVMWVPTQCTIPSVDEPLLDTADRNTPLGEAKRCAMNYTRVKESYEKLKKSAEVCR